jgi:hypothetical protein
MINATCLMSKQLNENLLSLRIQFRNSIETSHCLHVIFSEKMLCHELYPILIELSVFVEFQCYSHFFLFAVVWIT